jgi:hypothetical protein
MKQHEAANRVVGQGQAHYSEDLCGYQNRLTIKEEMEG